MLRATKFEVTVEYFWLEEAPEHYQRVYHVRVKWG